MDDRRALLAGILLTFAVLGLVSIYASHASGWRKLARFYRARGRFEGRYWTGAWGVMEGELAFPGVKLWIFGVGANRLGLRLDVSLFFVPVAPPLFIPWSDVAAHHAFLDWVRFEVVELAFARVPAAPIRIKESLARQIAAEVGPAFAWSPLP